MRYTELDFIQIGPQTKIYQQYSLYTLMEYTVQYLRQCRCQNVTTTNIPPELLSQVNLPSTRVHYFVNLENDDMRMRIYQTIGGFVKT